MPKFYTFMSTSAEGTNAFYHSLIFYEKFNANDLKTDFDSKSEAVKLAMTKKKAQRAANLAQDQLQRAADLGPKSAYNKRGPVSSSV